MILFRYIKGGNNMALIRPSADLRNNYNEISRICHTTKEPVYITRNGYNDLVVLSDESYELLLKERDKKEEEQIEKIVSQYFDKNYATLEEFRTNIFKQIEEAIKEIEDGKGIPMEKVVAEMEAKYQINDRI